jgi:hypothetical protein
MSLCVSSFELPCYRVTVLPAPFLITRYSCLLLVVRLFPASTGYCLSCVSFLKDVSQIQFFFWVVCGRSCFNDLAVFVFVRGVVCFRFLYALCCVGGSVLLILIVIFVSKAADPRVVVDGLLPWCSFHF